MPCVYALLSILLSDHFALIQYIGLLSCHFKILSTKKYTDLHKNVEMVKKEWWLFKFTDTEIKLVHVSINSK